MFGKNFFKSVAPWIGMSFIGVVGLWLLIEGEWLRGLLAGILFGCAFFFFMASKRVPVKYSALLILICAFNAAGVKWRLYDSMFFFDEAAHFITAFAITPCCAYFLLAPILGSFRGHKIAFVLLSTSLGLAIGALWEIFELSAGISATYVDTISDLALDAAGAFLAAIWASMDIKERS